MRGKFISGYLMDDKQMPAWIIFLMFIVMLKSCLTLSVGDIDLALERQNTVVIKVISIDKQALFKQLKTYGYTYLHQITPSTFIFDYIHADRTLQESLQIIKNVFTNQMLAIESVRIYENLIQPWDRGKDIHNRIFVDMHSLNSNHEGGNSSGISAVWSRGYSGKGVTVAVTGVGIETQLIDLQKNLNLDLSFNFVYNKSDITPEVIGSSQSKAVLLTDQGNNIAGVIAAEKDNGICGAGIAYKSKIVGIKIFAVKMKRFSSEPSPTLITASDVIARALTHRLYDIDVYVNAWTPSSPFDQLDLATRESIEFGATTGRRGLGAVYVVPVGPTGNTLSNNIYTITVGVLDVNRTKQQRNTQSDASVLTSGVMSSNMVTTSHDNKCLAKCEGYSAAMSQIAAIIALGLEANPRLSLREIQHLLVRASDYSQLQTNASLKRNGAGHYYNEMFGFGVLNAEKFINLSKAITVNQLIVKSVGPSVTSKIYSLKKNVEFCYSCDALDDVKCLTTIEHVAISVKTDIPLNDIKVLLMSPSGTSSVLMNNQIIEHPLKEARLISTNFWNELAFGTWVLAIQSQKNNVLSFNVNSLTLYGTHTMTKLSDAGNLPHKHICKNTKTYTDALIVNETTVSSTTETVDSDSDSKISIPLVVILPVGIVVMCGFLVFICKCGGTQGHVSTYVKPKKKQQAQQKQNLLFNRQISQDNKLHRQVSLLRQKSVHSDELAEDIEGEEAAAMNGELHRQVNMLRQKSDDSEELTEDIEGEEAARDGEV